MRDLTAAALAKVAQQYGNEPITILDIQWVEDGDVLQYADREVDGIPGKILEISDLDAVINISDNSDSQELAVILDDTNGAIKDIMNRNDVHKRNVFVYQYFEGLPLADRFLLFKGKINTPLVWNEGDRTISLVVLAQLEDVEVGFSPEEGQFEDMPQALVDQPWPSVFGTVTHSKTIKLTPTLSGVTAEGVGFPDFALPFRLQALVAICEYQTQFLAMTNSLCQQCLEAEQLRVTIIEQNATAKDSIRIFKGENFPRGDITLSIGSTLVDGHFGTSRNTRDRFYITGGSNNIDQHPSYRKFCWNPAGFRIIGSGWSAARVYTGGPQCTEEQIRNGGEKWTPVGGIYRVTTGVNVGGRSYIVPTGEIVGDNAGYVYIQPGATVKLYSAERQNYVVSITPGTVLRVVAWAQKDGQRFIQDIPSNWYSVAVEDFGAIQATILTLNDTLSKKENMGFEDEIFVTFKSTIGPNTVEIVEYLIDLYTDFSVDAASFAHVKDRLANYPSHFALYDKKNILELLQQIMWQARCAIYLKNDVFYLLYLPEEPTTVDTLTKKDLIFDTFQMMHTPTEDLVTKMVCEWTATGLQTEPFRTVLRHNIKKYGTQEQKFDFFIYDWVDAVAKSATFWLIRYANTWKHAEFEVPLTKLNLETFDSVTFDIGGLVADVPFPALIEKASYNSDNNTLSLGCWCPIKAGTMEVYDFAHPADIEEWKTFPTEYEIQQGYDGGDGPGKDVVIPPHFAYGSGGIAIVGVSGPDDESEENNYEEEDPYDEGENKKDDKGTPKPTDSGDIYPGEKIQRPGGTMEDPNAGPETPDAGGAANVPQPDGYGGPNSGNPEAPPPGPDSGEPSGGGSGSDQQDALNELPSCDDSEFANCPYVIVTWLYDVQKVSQPAGGGPCILTRDPPERGICTSGGFWQEEIIFNTNQEAQDFAAEMQATITQKGLTGDTIPYFAVAKPGVDDCLGTGETGAQGYCNKVPNGYGSGAWADGVPSNGFGE